ncbi:PilZ domain-containing protein [Rhodanobacter ginsengisoli]|uniref:PilZ domain-containing protein n=1 Tax=Rhodanobacter ginsengisoli TaxID=418646 RepID=A0ABW0QIV2_9GAMM
MNQASQDQAQRDQRRKQRKPVDFDAVVTDVITDQPFGRIGNLSATGMLLISPTAPQDEAIYQLRLPLPDNGSGSGQVHIDVGVQEQWHDQAASADLIWAGYRIIAISDADATRLHAWLEQPD